MAFIKDVPQVLKKKRPNGETEVGAGGRGFAGCARLPKKLAEKASGSIGHSRAITNNLS
jgi:hypothetical protein